MPEKSDLRPKAGDFIAGALIAVCAVVFGVFFMKAQSDGETPIAQVYLDGRLIREVSLGVDTSFTVEGSYTNTVTVKDGQICVSQSDCPGGDCTRTGPLGRTGGCIVCLPNRMEIRLTGGAEADISVG